MTVRDREIDSANKEERQNRVGETSVQNGTRNTGCRVCKVKLRSQY